MLTNLKPIEILRKIEYQKLLEIIISGLIILLVIFIIFPLNISMFLQVETFANRTFAFFIQFSLIILYLTKIILYKEQRPSFDFLTRRICLIFSITFIVNLLFHNIQISKYFDVFNQNLGIPQLDYNLYFFKYAYSITTYFVFFDSISKNEKLKKKLVDILIILGIIVSVLFLLVQFNFQIDGVKSSILNDFGEVDQKYSRFTLMSWNENEISLFFSCCYGLVISRLIDPINKSLFVLFLKITSLILILNAIILTGTRMGLVAIIVSIFTMFAILFFRKFNLKYILVTFFSSSIIVLYKFVFQDNVLKERIFVCNHGCKLNENIFVLGGRIDNWIYAINIGLTNPLLGGGLAQYFEYRSSLPENLIIELFTIAGFIPAILVIPLILSSLLISLKLSIKKESENLFLFIILLGSILSLNILSLKIFWILLAIFNSNLDKYIVSNKKVF